MSTDLTEAENSLLGGGVAVISVLTLQPTIYAKNARQQGLPLTLNPRLLYRGVGPNFANEAAQLSLQFGATGALKRLMPSNAAGEVAAACGAGALVAIIASPLELLMIQQQLHGASILATPLHVLRDHGVRTLLGRGLGLSMLRDAFSVGGMLGCAPVAQRWLSGWLAPSADDSQRGATVSSMGHDALASVLASAIGGMMGALLSHPFDVAKTCMQGDLGRERYGGSMATWRVLLSEGGVSRLLSGVGFRTANIVGTVFIANECLTRLPPYLMRLTRGRQERTREGEEAA